MTKSGGKTYQSPLDTVCSLHNWYVLCSEGVQPCFGERELLGRANLHFGPAATVKMQIWAKDLIVLNRGLSRQR